MARIRKEYWECDTCNRKFGNERCIRKIKFKRNEEEFEFDACFVCLEENSIRRVYKKICDILKGKGNK